jgi:hypothetical protein
MDYLELYDQDAGTSGATTVGNGGLGMSPVERANVPSATSRKKKKRLTRTSPSPSGKPATDGVSHPLSMAGTPPK